jgi:hypothetical protein
MKFVSDLRWVSGFLPGTPVSSTNKTDCQDFTEILLKVALNTIYIPNHIQHGSGFFRILYKFIHVIG